MIVARLDYPTYLYINTKMYSEVIAAALDKEIALINNITIREKIINLSFYYSSGVMILSYNHRYFS